MSEASSVTIFGKKKSVIFTEEITPEIVVGLKNKVKYQLNHKGVDMAGGIALTGKHWKEMFKTLLASTRQPS